MRVNSINNNNQNRMSFCANVKQNQFILNLITDVVREEGVNGANRVSRAIDKLNGVRNNHNIECIEEEVVGYHGHVYREMVLKNSTTGKKAYIRRDHSDAFFCKYDLSNKYGDSTDIENKSEKRIAMSPIIRKYGHKSELFDFLVDSAINFKEFWEESESPMFRMIENIYNKCVK